MPYDFEGWATKNDLECADGLTVRSGAFKVDDGKRVPLVWNHEHNSVSSVLGHAMLENRKEGVYAYCSFNKTAAGQDAKEIVSHGDVVSLSIWANNVQQVGSDVIHGVIREVSLVLAGANPGAFIESVMAHGESMGKEEDEGVFYTGEGIIISHADLEEGEELRKKESEKKEETTTDSKEEKTEEKSEGKTVKEVLDGMTDEQKAAVGIIVEQAIKDAKSDGGEEPPKEKEEKEMKHNVFEGQDSTQTISHSDMEKIFSDAKRCGGR